MSETALILGARGRFGRSVAEALWNAGWRIRVYDRAQDDLTAAAEGADLIVNGWNPTYDRWAHELPRLTDAVVGAARSSGATVLQPANIYVYGSGAPSLLTASTPHRATNPLGRLRIEMEERLRRSGVPVILLRAGEYVDTEASGNWIDRVILKPHPRGYIHYPGDPRASHSWAYLPDLAEVARRLAERRADLPLFHEVLFPGYDWSGEELARLAGWVTGRETGVRAMQWLPIRLSRPVWPMARHLLEMRYLWNMPHRIDRTAFDAEFPEFRETPGESAVEKAIAALGRGSQVARDDRPRWSAPSQAA